ncbi:MAG: DUF4097 family beta strand repeat-containing protein [Gemmatimonadaceae bacterium]
MTDTVLSVAGQTRVDIHIPVGRLEVSVWDRTDVRLVAIGSALPRIDRSTSVIGLTQRDSRPSNAGEYQITIPRAMSAAIMGEDLPVVVHAGGGTIIVRNYAGVIRVFGGRDVAATSTLGGVEVSGTRGPVHASSVSGAIRLVDVAGNVTAESVDNHIVLTRVESDRVTASTVGGVIEFEGPIRRTGQYDFTTHDGSIILRVAGDLDATISVGTVRGGISSEFPYAIRSQVRRGVFTAVAKSGAAQLSLQTFEGGIAIRHAPRSP